MSLEDNCNKEIFLAYNEEGNNNQHGASVEIFVTTELMTMVEYLRRLTTSLDYDIVVLHGILTKASSIPKNLRGKKAYIILEDIYNADQALILEVGTQSDKGLAEKINALIEGKGGSLPSLPWRNYAVDVDIEDVFILYGYEVSVILSLDEEELDEEIIDTCKKIADDAATINKHVKQIMEIKING